MLESITPFLMNEQLEKIRLFLLGSDHHRWFDETHLQDYATELRALTEPHFIGGPWVLKFLEKDGIAKRRIKALLESGVRYSRDSFSPDCEQALHLDT